MNKRTTILLVIAAFAFAFSFVRYQSQSVEKETRKVQRHLLSREKILNDYVSSAMEASPTQWLDIDKFPDDMVLYKYVADTLQSWINLFPISNDEVDLLPLWYRIHDMNNRNLYNTPLAYITEGGQQYINLGSSWYIVRSYRAPNVKIIAGILIKTEYISQNSILKNSVNEKLGLHTHFTTVPVYIDDGNVIYDKAGNALFSIINNSPLSYQKPSSGLQWISFLFIILAIFSYHISKRDFKSLSISLVSLIALHIGTTFLSQRMESDNIFFSPNLYADNYFESLGGLMISHFFIFLCSLAIFMARKKIVKSLLSSRLWLQRIVKCLFILVTLWLIFYIHYSFRSIIINSNITLELYRLEELSIYSIIIYAAYSLLFMSLLFILHIVHSVVFKVKTFSFFSIKSLLVYILVISIYSALIISIYGFNKEYKNNKVWTDKLAVERDITLELQLRSIENHIMADPMIRLFIGIPNGEQMIINRLSELYFWNIAQKYDLRITICGDGESVITENYPLPVNCFDFFKNDIILKYGVQLALGSPFYYVNNYENRISYIGVFSVLRERRRFDMYLEIDSKLTKEAIGYPALLLSSKETGNKELGAYSYAKYYDRRLTSSKGKYDYPTYYDTDTIEEGYSYKTINGYIHFLNKVSDDNIIAVSRPTRKALPYVVFFSYIYLFFGAVILSLTRLSRQRSGVNLFNLPKHSFRKKITYLLTISLVCALIAMGIGSVIFTIRLIDDNNYIQMKEKIQSVQSAMSDVCRYAQSYNEINNLSIFGAMDGVATNTQVDINLFDPHGRLIRSTKPEVFDQYLASSRMDPHAYHNIIYNNRRVYIQEESIANLKFHSLYSPIFNVNGALVAIANVPYFKNDTDFREGASSIIATIINLYLLLIIAALLSGITISNSVSKPLAEISKKMEEMDFSQQAEHIDYKSKDELGMLVKSYNKMVDDLDHSTKQLAQNEREQAWKEMARQIAHEIKNPLTPMKLSIQHLVRLKRQNIPDWQDRFDALSSSLIEQIDILSETATEFSSFAKFYNEDDSRLDLIELLKEQFILFDNRENLSLEFKCQLETAIVMAKRSQISRAFVNIISNAIQAIENKTGAVIRISVAREGDYYVIDIEDNGHGVSPENQAKLFKPNFTTKTSGTGLGLAICKNIIDQSRGKISYHPSEMGGADFRVELPSLSES